MTGKVIIVGDNQPKDITKSLDFRVLSFCMNNLGNSYYVTKKSNKEEVDWSQACQWEGSDDDLPFAIRSRDTREEIMVILRYDSDWHPEYVTIYGQ
ncbi:MAG: hypothetical protein NTV24_05130, partial [Candidatus Woesebacteria bacterium]|nr:hypothetical protein [Candidatus Woesebacteria bacterium]